MTLEEQLVANLPRNRSGSLAADRFEFQRNWALCELLLLHVSGSDYMMTFDHHEDLAVLNAEANPTEYRAYQIKTKGDGSWTDAALTKRPAGKDDPLPSILGKLCSAMAQFATSVKLLQFVSNASFRIVLAANNKCDLSANLIRFDEIAADKRTKIVDALQKELPTISASSLSGILEFKVTEISLADHAAHTRGKLVDALERLFPGQPFCITPVYRAILGEITARNNNLEDIDNYQEYLRKKSLSRSRFTEILKDCGVAKEAANWATIEARLNSENTPLPIIRSLKKEWATVQLDRLDKREDVQHVAMLVAIREAVQQVKYIPQLLKQMGMAFVLLKRRANWPYSDEYLQTWILVYIYES